MRPVFPALPIVVAVLSAWAWAGCSQPPTGAVLAAISDAAAGAVDLPQPVTRVDILWVLDHSPGSCDEESALAQGVTTFIKQLQAAGLDPRMAMVTQQQLADRDLTSPVVINKVGQFMHKAATKFPPNCTARYEAPCADDSQCQTGVTGYTFPPANACAPASTCQAPGNFPNPFPGAGAACQGDPTCGWRCKSTTNPANASNDNCTVNGYCWRHCKTDQECRDAFEPGVPAAQQRMKCFNPGGPPSEQSGCQMPPPTEDCPPPGQLPAVLGSGTVTIGGKTWNEQDLWHCLLVPGASQTQESKFEGPFRAAWLALDPNGPNCPHDSAGKPTAACQNRQLLRDDALLAIVYVGDEDDCSVDLSISLVNNTLEENAKLKSLLPLEVWDSCQKLGDRLGSNHWLNDAACEYWRNSGKVAGLTVCACDCRAMPANSAERTGCEAKVAADRPKFVRQDDRFATAGDWAWRFKSLKKNPNQVLFAAITGYALTGLPGDPTADQDAIAYYFSVIKNIGPSQAPRACQGARGGSGFGAKYLQLAEAFGGGGLMQNLCLGQDLSGQLAGIATWLGGRAGKPVPPCADGDGDGFAAATCGGSDCADDNGQVRPDAKEICGNGLDDDCDGATDSVPKVRMDPVTGLSVALGDACSP